MGGRAACQGNEFKCMEGLNALPAMRRATGNAHPMARPTKGTKEEGARLSIITAERAAEI